MFLQESNAWVQEIIANIRSILISFQQQYRSLALSSTNSTPMITPVHKPTLNAGSVASKQKTDVSQWILRLTKNLIEILRQKHDEEKHNLCSQH